MAFCNRNADEGKIRAEKENFKQGDGRLGLRSLPDPKPMSDKA